MPFSAATFDRWPFGRHEMDPHYRVALDEMTLTGDEDDLSSMFPLLMSARPLPKLAERTRRVLARYEAKTSVGAVARHHDGPSSVGHAFRRLQPMRVMHDRGAHTV